MGSRAMRGFIDLMDVASSGLPPTLIPTIAIRMQSDQKLSLWTMLWPAGSPARPRIMPSVKNPRMTRLPPMPLQTEILRPVPISKPETACRSPPAPVSRAP